MILKQRKPNRLQGYDYAQDNLYFVTSCVQDRIRCFGEIKNKQMQLNQYGEIAKQQWHWLGQQYPYVVLHAFVVMPNHIHGIIEINRGIVHSDGIVGTGRDLSLQYNDLSLQYNDLSLQYNDLSLQYNDLSLQYNDLSPQPKIIKSLSQLMGAYKTTTSKQIHLLCYDIFAWQRSFHDHIIRDEQAYEKISEYIHNNPAKWQEDKFYTL